MSRIPGAKRDSCTITSTIIVTIRTNRDLYVAITKLAERHLCSSLTLEEYLRSLLLAANRYADRDSLTLEQFYELLSESFVSPPQEFDETWRLEYDELPVRNSGFCGWRATLLRQIVDLR